MKTASNLLSDMGSTQAVLGGCPWQFYVRQMLVELGGDAQGPGGEIVKEFCILYASEVGAPDPGILSTDTESAALEKLLVSLGVPTGGFGTHHARVRALCQYTA
jgi:hypothetical protein